MVKFKLKIFKSCRSKHPSTLPEHPIPIFHRHNIISLDFPTTAVPSKHQQQPHRSSFKSHVSSTFGCGSKSGDLSDSDYFQWQEDDQWHVVAKIYDVESPRRKIYNSSVSGDNTDDDGFPFPLPPVDKKKRRRCRRVKLNNLRNISTDCDRDSGLFTSGYSRSRRLSTRQVIPEHSPQLIPEYSPIMLSTRDYRMTNLAAGDFHNHVEDETETLISSSRSFSTDYSTDFNPQLETIREFAPISVSNRNIVRKKRNPLLKRNGGGSDTSAEYGSPARLSVFKKLIPCEVAGKMKESFAMVKRSEDPYEDFKKSMVEMIMEKEMYEEGDLEQLLQCYLSLNSRFHHGVIVEAFAEIWDTMFGGGGDDDD